MTARIENGRQIEGTDPEAVELMREILVTGISALGGHGPTRRSAEAWTRADDGAWPLSFEYVCEALGFEPDQLRSALLAPNPR
jgi:hypothetical protein